MTTAVGEKQFDLHQIALEGYAYFYPLVTMELTRRQWLPGHGSGVSRPGEVGALSRR